MHFICSCFVTESDHELAKSSQKLAQKDKEINKPGPELNMVPNTKEQGRLGLVVTFVHQRKIPQLSHVH